MFKKTCFDFYWGCIESLDQWRKNYHLNKIINTKIVCPTGIGIFWKVAVQKMLT